LARKLGFYPEDPDVAMANDWIVETYADNFNDLVQPLYIMATGGT
jgi:hypothetical protein